MTKYGKTFCNKFSYDKIARKYRNKVKITRMQLSWVFLKKIASVHDKDKNRKGSAGKGNKKSDTNTCSERRKGQC